MGRTPHGGGGDGRDHHTSGFTVWLAGAGIKGGVVHGATDEFGMEAVENVVEIHDLHATILHLLGLDHERLTYRYGGRDMSLTDVHGHVIKRFLRSVCRSDKNTAALDKLTGGIRRRVEKKLVGTEPRQLSPT